MAPTKFNLPVSIITEADVAELNRELEGIEDFFMKVKKRPAGMPITLPKTTKNMNDLVSYNSINILKEDERKKLHLMLQTLRTKAPIIHISFSSDPTRAFLEKIIQWFRKNVNPLILIQVGLQPNIGAGFTLRTPNHFFDFSLRQYLNEKKPELINGLLTGIKWV